MFELIKRENAVFSILQEFIDANLNFVIIGGYAISAYKHRFSIDADIVIKKEDKSKFETVLSKNKFVKTVMKKLDHVYSKEFVSYKTKGKLPVSVDLLVDGAGSRTTNASFSFEQLKEHSEKKKIIGTEKEVNVMVPKKEILIVLKLHSGRLTDFRDIVALTKNIDFELIKSIIWRGEKRIVKDNIKKLLSLVDDKGFVDSFKGVFVEKRYDVDLEEVKKFKQLL
ncbi:MAG: DUF6036 family nucleotidyltransferase [Candidatus Woesearchaeota archaeon]